MEILLLGIYSFFVWLIFIKLKLLPWTTPWKVGVAIFPIVCIAIMLLLLNIFAPTTTDVRVVKYVVPVVSQVRGRVTEVPVENNRPVKKGDVLFKIDPTPYRNDVQSLEARLIADQARVAGTVAATADASTVRANWRRLNMIALQSGGSRSVARGGHHPRRIAERQSDVLAEPTRTRREGGLRSIRNRPVRAVCRSRPNLQPRANNPRASDRARAP